MHHFSFDRYRILVVGDVMVDKYLDGSVARISPEAPVPVVLHKAERAVLGGAANVAVNIASLGASVDCIGVIGNDETGAALIAMLRDDPVDHDGRRVNLGATLGVTLGFGH